MSDPAEKAHTTCWGDQLYLLIIYSVLRTLQYYGRRWLILMAFTPPLIPLES